MLAVEREEKAFAATCHAMTPFFTVVFKINDFWLGTILEEQIDDLTMQCGIIVIQNRSEHSAVVTGLFDVRDF